MIACTSFHAFVTFVVGIAPENAIRAFKNPDGTWPLLSLRFLPFPVRSTPHKYYYSVHFFRFSSSAVHGAPAHLFYSH